MQSITDGVRVQYVFGGGRQGWPMGPPLIIDQDNHLHAFLSPDSQVSSPCSRC